MARKWTEEERAAHSALMKARHANRTAEQRNAIVAKARQVKRIRSGSMRGRFTAPQRVLDDFDDFDEEG